MLSKIFDDIKIYFLTLFQNYYADYSAKFGWKEGGTQEI